LSPEQAAYLAGGPWRSFLVAFTHLTGLGLLREEGGHFTRDKELPPRTTPLERCIWESAIEPARVADLYARASGPLEGVRKRLQQLGLLMDAATANYVCWVPALMVFLVAVFGGIKIVVGVYRAKSVGFLILGVIAAVVVACVYAFARLQRSWRGENVLEALKKQHAALETTARSNPVALSPSDAPMALALFGTVAIAGVHASLLSPLPPPGATGSTWWGHSGCGSYTSCGTGCSSSSCGGGSGCGGGGGGGCGGCGGGGGD
jgi:uncharacterized protein (TIGR04222 family)